jgi:A/G-specific adenine glycosylase
MDYGVHLKKLHPNPSRRSAHHTQQSRFEGSDRQIRGAILRTLAKATLTERRLSAAAALDLKKRSLDGSRFSRILVELCAEGLVVKKGRNYLIP